MEVYGVISREDFEAALAAAWPVDGMDRPLGLAAPADAGLWGRVAEVRDKVKRALDDAFQFGADRAAAAIDAAVDAADRLLAEAGRRAREVHAYLLRGLQDYLTMLLDAVVAQVRPALVVGSLSMPLQDVQLARRISVNGSLKANIKEICAMTGGGEVTVTARYGAG